MIPEWFFAIGYIAGTAVTFVIMNALVMKKTPVIAAHYINHIMSCGCDECQQCTNELINKVNNHDKGSNV